MAADDSHDDGARTLALVASLRILCAGLSALSSLQAALEAAEEVPPDEAAHKLGSSGAAASVRAMLQHGGAPSGSNPSSSAPACGSQAEASAAILAGVGQRAVSSPLAAILAGAGMPIAPTGDDLLRTLHAVACAEDRVGRVPAALAAAALRAAWPLTGWTPSDRLSAAMGAVRRSLAPASGSADARATAVLLWRELGQPTAVFCDDADMWRAALWRAMASWDTPHDATQASTGKQAWAQLAAQAASAVSALGLPDAATDTLGSWKRHFQVRCVVGMLVETHRTAATFEEQSDADVLTVTESSRLSRSGAGRGRPAGGQPRAAGGEPAVSDKDAAALTGSAVAAAGGLLKKAKPGADAADGLDLLAAAGAASGSESAGRRAAGGRGSGAATSQRGGGRADASLAGADGGAAVRAMDAVGRCVSDAQAESEEVARAALVDSTRGTSTARRQRIQGLATLSVLREAAAAAHGAVLGAALADLRAGNTSSPAVECGVVSLRALANAVALGSGIEAAVAEALAPEIASLLEAAGEDQSEDAAGSAMRDSSMLARPAELLPAMAAPCSSAELAQLAAVVLSNLPFDAVSQSSRSAAAASAPQSPEPRSLGGAKPSGADAALRGLRIVQEGAAAVSEGASEDDARSAATPTFEPALHAGTTPGRAARALLAGVSGGASAQGATAVREALSAALQSLDRRRASFLTGPPDIDHSKQWLRTCLRACAAATAAHSAAAKQPRGTRGTRGTRGAPGAAAAASEGGEGDLHADAVALVKAATTAVASPLADAIREAAGGPGSGKPAWKVLAQRVVATAVAASVHLPAAGIPVAAAAADVARLVRMGLADLAGQGAAARKSQTGTRGAADSGAAKRQGKPRVGAASGLEGGLRAAVAAAMAAGEASGASPAGAGWRAAGLSATQGARRARVLAATSRAACLARMSLRCLGRQLDQLVSGAVKAAGLPLPSVHYSAAAMSVAGSVATGLVVCPEPRSAHVPAAEVSAVRMASVGAAVGSAVPIHAGGPASFAAAAARLVLAAAERALDVLDAEATDATAAGEVPVVAADARAAAVDVATSALCATALRWPVRECTMLFAAGSALLELLRRAAGGGIALPPPTPQNSPKSATDAVSAAAAGFQVAAPSTAGAVSVADASAAFAGLSSRAQRRTPAGVTEATMSTASILATTTWRHATSDVIDVARGLPLAEDLEPWAVASIAPVPQAEAGLAGSLGRAAVAFKASPVAASWASISSAMAVLACPSGEEGLSQAVASSERDAAEGGDGGAAALAKILSEGMQSRSPVLRDRAMTVLTDSIGSAAKGVAHQSAFSGAAHLLAPLLSAVVNGASLASGPAAGLAEAGALSGWNEHAETLPLARLTDGAAGASTGGAAPAAPEAASQQPARSAKASMGDPLGSLGDDDLTRVLTDSTAVLASGGASVGTAPVTLTGVGSDGVAAAAKRSKNTAGVCRVLQVLLAAESPDTADEACVRMADLPAPLAAAGARVPGVITLAALLGAGGHAPLTMRGGAIVRLVASLPLADAGWARAAARVAAVAAALPVQDDSEADSASAAALAFARRLRQGALAMLGSSAVWRQLRLAHGGDFACGGGLTAVLALLATSDAASKLAAGDPSAPVPGPGDLTAALAMGAVAAWIDDAVAAAAAASEAESAVATAARRAAAGKAVAALLRSCETASAALPAADGVPPAASVSAVLLPALAASLADASPAADSRIFSAGIRMAALVLAGSAPGESGAADLGLDGLEFAGAPGTDWRGVETAFAVQGTWRRTLRGVLGVLSRRAEAALESAGVDPTAVLGDPACDDDGTLSAVAQASLVAQAMGTPADPPRPAQRPLGPTRAPGPGPAAASGGGAAPAASAGAEPVAKPAEGSADADVPSLIGAGDAEALVPSFEYPSSAACFDGRSVAHRLQLCKLDAHTGPLADVAVRRIAVARQLLGAEPLAEGADAAVQPSPLDWYQPALQAAHYAAQGAVGFGPDVTPRAGDEVVRGPDWKWGGDDCDSRGKPCKGRVVRMTSARWAPRRKSAVEVVWSSGKTNICRYGATAAGCVYDVEVTSRAVSKALTSPASKAVESSAKWATALPSPRDVHDAAKTGQAGRDDAAPIPASHQTDASALCTVSALDPPGRCVSVATHPSYQCNGVGVGLALFAGQAEAGKSHASPPDRPSTSAAAAGAGGAAAARSAPPPPPFGAAFAPPPAFQAEALQQPFVFPGRQTSAQDPFATAGGDGRTSPMGAGGGASGAGSGFAAGAAPATDIFSGFLEAPSRAPSVAGRLNPDAPSFNMFDSPARFGPAAESATAAQPTAASPPPAAAFAAGTRGPRFGKSKARGMSHSSGRAGTAPAPASGAAERIAKQETAALVSSGAATMAVASAGNVVSLCAAAAALDVLAGVLRLAAAAAKDGAGSSAAAISGASVAASAAGAAAPQDTAAAVRDALFGRAGGAAGAPAAPTAALGASVARNAAVSWSVMAGIGRPPLATCGPSVQADAEASLGRLASAMAAGPQATEWAVALSVVEATALSDVSGSSAEAVLPNGLQVRRHRGNVPQPDEALEFKAARQLTASAEAARGAAGAAAAAEPDAQAAAATDPFASVTLQLAAATYPSVPNDGSARHPASGVVLQNVPASPGWSSTGMHFAASLRRWWASGDEPSLVAPHSVALVKTPLTGPGVVWTAAAGTEAKRAGPPPGYTPIGATVSMWSPADSPDIATAIRADCVAAVPGSHTPIVTLVRQKSGGSRLVPAEEPGALSASEAGGAITPARGLGKAAWSWSAARPGLGALARRFASVAPSLSALEFGVTVSLIASHARADEWHKAVSGEGSEAGAPSARTSVRLLLAVLSAAQATKFGALRSRRRMPGSSAHASGGPSSAGSRVRRSHDSAERESASMLSAEERSAVGPAVMAEHAHRHVVASRAGDGAACSDATGGSFSSQAPASSTEADWRAGEAADRAARSTALLRLAARLLSADPLLLMPPAQRSSSDNGASFTAAHQAVLRILAELASASLLRVSQERAHARRELAGTPAGRRMDAEHCLPPPGMLSSELCAIVEVVEAAVAADAVVTAVRRAQASSSAASSGAGAGAEPVAAAAAGAAAAAASAAPAAAPASAASAADDSDLSDEDKSGSAAAVPDGPAKAQLAFATGSGFAPLVPKAAWLQHLCEVGQAARVWRGAWPPAMLPASLVLAADALGPVASEACPRVVSATEIRASGGRLLVSSRGAARLTLEVRMRGILAPFNALGVDSQLLHSSLGTHTLRVPTSSVLLSYPAPRVVSSLSFSAQPHLEGGPIALDVSFGGKRVATRGAGKGWVTAGAAGPLVRVGAPMGTPVIRWHVFLESMDGGRNVFVGVARARQAFASGHFLSNAEPELGFVGNCKDGHGKFYNYRSGNEYVRAGRRFEPGDIVTLELDVARGHLGVVQYGEPDPVSGVRPPLPACGFGEGLTVSSATIPLGTEVCPAVSMFKPGCAVQLWGEQELPPSHEATEAARRCGLYPGVLSPATLGLGPVPAEDDADDEASPALGPSPLGLARSASDDEFLAAAGEVRSGGAAGPEDDGFDTSGIPLSRLRMALSLQAQLLMPLRRCVKALRVGRDDPNTAGELLLTRPDLFEEEDRAAEEAKAAAAAAESSAKARKEGARALFFRRAATLCRKQTPRSAKEDEERAAAKARLAELASARAGGHQWPGAATASERADGAAAAAGAFDPDTEPFEVVVLPRASSKSGGAGRSGPDEASMVAASASSEGGRLVHRWACNAQVSTWTAARDEAVAAMAAAAWAKAERERAHAIARKGRMQADAAARRQPGNMFWETPEEEAEAAANAGRRRGIGARPDPSSAEATAATRGSSAAIAGDVWADSVLSVTPVELHAALDEASTGAFAAADSAAQPSGAAAAAASAGAGSEGTAAAAGAGGARSKTRPSQGTRGAAAGAAGAASSAPTDGAADEASAAAATAAASDQALRGLDEDRDPRSTAELEDISFTAVEARWMLLRAWSARFVSVAALVDFAAPEEPGALATLVLGAARSALPSPVRAALWESALASTARRTSKASPKPTDAHWMVKNKSPSIPINRRSAATALASLREAAAHQAAGSCQRSSAAAVAPSLSGASMAAAVVSGAAASTTVGQLVGALGTLPPWSLRNTERAFFAQLAGEFADDYGGPYRTVLASFESEVQPPEAEDAAAAAAEALDAIRATNRALADAPATKAAVGAAVAHSGVVPLFRLTPNARAALAVGGEAGLADEVVPIAGRTLLEATRSPQLARALAASYEAAGVLMGIALRTGAPLGMRFAPVVWRRLLDAVSGRAAWSGSASVSSAASALWAAARNGAEGQQSAAAALLRRAERSSLAARASSTLPGELAAAEAVASASWDGAIAAMARGMLTQVPGPLLRLFAVRELSEGVAGVGDVDVAELRRGTLYEGQASSLGEGMATHKPAARQRGVVNMFWRILEGFTARERALYLRFVWGRSRLPSSAAALGSGGENPSGLSASATASSAGAAASAASSTSNSSASGREDVDDMTEAFTVGLHGARLRHLLNVIPVPATLDRQARALLSSAERRGPHRSHGAGPWLSVPERRRMAELVKRMPLPSASTCFGRMTLPAYPTEDIMAARLRYALANCDDIDADHTTEASRAASL
ncbi:hypothetical protein FNF29_04050 [Cafeteria roenbergensis]|uniref:Uncharacterized protein n=2 Tax=Cafeteria roenbergensis TaxID=33653 RepID=A0A5A8CI70_CAFRO|nr:hypothetical protein FNF29_04050 [Cafeteria roenbergensis]|eukprot:KAA0152184.1 hypothetical protein FNF29_04050 [Cafeteria roenbergensis]